MDPKMDPNAPASGGFQWKSLERWLDAKLSGNNDLQRFMVFHGFPWIIVVERVKGIEPSS